MSNATSPSPYLHTSSSGKQYYLNRRDAVTGGGKSFPLFFFSKALKPETAVTSIPEGYTITESNGMPVLKKTPAA